jgi:hypothetical protein
MEYAGNLRLMYASFHLELLWARLARPLTVRALPLSSKRIDGVLEYDSFSQLAAGGQGAKGEEVVWSF